MQRSALTDEPHPNSCALPSKAREPVLSSKRLSSLFRKRRQGTGAANQGSNSRDDSLDSHDLASHTFTWALPAEEVFVTGTFDDWQKTVQLENKEGIFQKEVKLPKVDTYYKFVVDGRWTVNTTGCLENDANGSVNNFLRPQDFNDGRWAIIRAKAAKRAVPLAAGLQGQDQELEGSASGDEDIKKRVARIKARVAELTRDSYGPSAHTTADIGSEGLLSRSEGPAPPEPSMDVDTAEEFPKQLGIRQGNARADDSSMQKPWANESTKNLDTRE